PDRRDRGETQTHCRDRHCGQAFLRGLKLIVRVNWTMRRNEPRCLYLDLMGCALYVIKIEFRPNAFCTCASRGVPANDFHSRTSIDAASHDAGARLLVL